MVPVEGHDGTEEEEGEVEVVFQKVGELVVAVLLLTVLKAEAHAAHDAKAAAAVEQDVLEVKGPSHQGFLTEESRNTHFLTFFFNLRQLNNWSFLTCQELYGSNLMEASVASPAAKHISLLFTVATL